MIRPCRSNPKLSAYQSLEGELSCNHASLAHLGSKIIDHDHPTNLQMWDPHGHFGWLISPAIDHYRFFTVFNPKTKGISIASTFYWSQCNRFIAPKITPEEQLTTAAPKISKALKQNAPLILPDEPLQQNIEKLCSMFKDQVESITTKIIPSLQLETFLPTAPNDA